ncbi:ABC transporter ATP-binding protein [Halomonas elongata]|uniref:ABC transporter ATP-binding protein n=1 Tax=Halomonas elongata TaxID=2746 RepID=UPI002E27D158|nr:ABC transporter ATP-binding protein [Halomonas elongata]WVI72265.1 ABC transporter ATP-binding protein [Halomonas elongata]
MGRFLEDIRRFFRVMDFSKSGKRVRSLFVVLALMSIVSSVLTVAQPFLYMELIDSIVGEAGGLLEFSTEIIILVYGVCFLVARVIDELWKAVFTNLTLSAQRSLAEKAFDHIIRLPSSFFLGKDKHSLPEIISKARSGVHEIISVSLETVVPVVLEFFLVSLIVYMLFPGSVLVILIASVVVFVVVAIVGSEMIRPWQRGFTEENNKTHQVLGEILSSEETIKSFNVEDGFKKRYLSHMAVFENYCYKFFRWSAFIGSMQMLAIGGALIPMLFISFNFLKDDALTLGAFVMINVLTIQLIMPLRRLAYAYRQVKESAVDIEQLDKVMSIPSETQRSDDGRGEVILESPSIFFDNVCFCYEEGEGPVLNDVSFTVPEGKTYAFVGASGAGKSTISKLIMRYYDVSSGNILLGGRDVEGFSRDAVRRFVGMVSQDVVLFNDTLRFNLDFGECVEDARLVSALKAVDLDGFVDALPNGVDTMVGDRGMRLSGGQRQRVGIARAILKDPKVLIFDEATSSLDMHTEKTVSENINIVSEGKTTIVIAHRLSTIINADKILVLDQGEIVSSGTHSELIESCDVYRKLYMSGGATSVDQPLQMLSD